MGKKPAPISLHSDELGESFPMACPSFLPTGSPRATQLSPSPARVRRGNGICLFPSSGPAVGCLCVLYPGNTRFQRNYQNFGAGRPKATARNRCRGSTGIRLCPVPVGAPLGWALPGQHWQHLWLQSPRMLMPQRPSSTTLGSPSQDFHPWITAREDTAEPGRDFSGQ